jgi:hypothetical protein
MSIKWLQDLYDKIGNITTPDWVKAILKEIQDLVFSAILQVGEDYIKKIENKIIEVSAKPISNEDKFKEVFTYIRVSLDLAAIKDSVIRMIIEIVVNRLKKNRTI